MGISGRVGRPNTIRLNRVRYLMQVLGRHIPTYLRHLEERQAAVPTRSKGPRHKYRALY